MSPERANSRDAYARLILEAIDSGATLSQRSLARQLGIAVGLANLLLHRMARKGWIRLTKVKPNRMRYLLTPTGLTEKARMSRVYFAGRVQFYAETRDRIRDTLMALPDGRRIVFYGAGEVAEIGFICLRYTGFELVGVIDDERGGSFFGLPVLPSTRLAGTTIDGQSFDSLVVMSFWDTDAIADTVAALGVPAARVHYL